MSKIKNGGLDQYGAVPFEQQQFGTAGVESVKQLYWWMLEWRIISNWSYAAKVIIRKT